MKRCLLPRQIYRLDIEKLRYESRWNRVIEKKSVEKYCYKDGVKDIIAQAKRKGARISKTDTGYYIEGRYWIGAEEKQYVLFTVFIFKV